MIRAMVVDDESFIRKGVIAMLNRELEEKIEFFEAENGFKALQICKEEMPHLVISDIHMPGCNGLDFIRQLRAINRSQIVIVISGYENFQYAKEAISLGVKEYVTKPIKRAEFIAIIVKYIHDIKENEKHVRQEIMKRIKREKIESQLKQNLILQLLTNGENTENALVAKKLQEVEILTGKELSQCALIQYRIKRTREADYIDFAVKNMTDEILGADDKVEPFLTVPLKEGILAVIFDGIKGKNINKHSRNALIECCNKIKRYCGADVFVGIGETIYLISNLYQSYEGAMEALDYKIYQQGSCIQFCSDMAESMEKPAFDFRPLIQSIKEIEEQKVMKPFMEIAKLPPSRANLKGLRHAYEQIIMLLHKELMLYEMVDSEALIPPSNFGDLWNVFELRKEMFRYMGQGKKILEASAGELPNKKLFIEILRFVDSNITEDIDLNTVAEQFNRSPNYISSLFKKGGKEGFSDYVKNKRIEIAKKLLADCTIPISNVAELCGYPNSKYFSVVFKKLTGYTPKKYRNSL